MRKVLVVGFFVVVFGFPVTWYLVLQIFGQNQFELPILEVPLGCAMEQNNLSIAYDSVELASAPNLKLRVREKIETIDLDIRFLPIMPECQSSSSLLFYDREARLRGAYDLSLEEVDRLFAELDIYVLNNYGR